MAKRNFIGARVVLDNGIRATVLEQVDSGGHSVFLVRVVDEDSTLPTLLTVPALKMASLPVLDEAREDPPAH